MERAQGSLTDPGIRPVSQVVHLAQPSDQMFERNVGHVAKRGREVEVWVEGIPEPKIGFVAGLDEEFLQVCLSKNAALSSVRRDMILSMEETGIGMGPLITATKNTPDQDRVDRIKEKTNHFQKRASAVLGKLS